MFEIRVLFIVVGPDGACASHIDGSGEARCLQTISRLLCLSIIIFGYGPIVDVLKTFERKHCKTAFQTYVNQETSARVFASFLSGSMKINYTAVVPHLGGFIFCLATTAKVASGLIT